MHNFHAAHLTVGFGQEGHTHVGEPRDRQPRDALQRGLRIQRGGEDAAGIGQELQFAGALLDGPFQIAGVPLQRVLLVIQLALVLPGLHGPDERGHKVLAVNGLLDEVVGAAAQRLHGQIVLAVPGDQQRRRVRPQGLDLRQQGQAVGPGHLDVRDDSLVVDLCDALQRPLRGVAGLHVHLLHPQPQRLRQRLQQHGVVVDQEDQFCGDPFRSHDHCRANGN